MVLYPNKLPESERVCSGICTVVNTEKQVVKNGYLQTQSTCSHALRNIPELALIVEHTRNYRV